jgi:hypothetical protein
MKKILRFFLARLVSDTLTTKTKKKKKKKKFDIGHDCLEEKKFNS